MTRKFLIYIGLVLTAANCANAVAQSAATSARKPNVVYFLVDNLGMGELSSYSGGPFKREPLIPLGAPLDFVPKHKQP